MFDYRVTLGVLAAIALAGCGGGSSSSSAQASVAPAASASAGAAASSAPATFTSAAPGAESSLPVYPGATKMKTPPVAINMCGHKMTGTVYSIKGASSGAVADWYAGKMPGSTELHDTSIKSATMHPTLVVSADGSQAASAVNIPSMGTMIDLIAYDPAISPDDLQMYKNSVSADPAVRAQGVAAAKAKCGPGFSFGT